MFTSLRNARLIKKLMLGLVLAAALVALTHPASAESGCHDRGNQGPVAVAGR